MNNPNVITLIEAYANACFDQALNNRINDPAPEARREELMVEVNRLLGIEMAYRRTVVASGRTNGYTDLVSDGGLDPRNKREKD